MKSDFVCFDERFNGAVLAEEWSIADTSSAGTPTKAMHANGLNLAFDNTVEAQNVCLHFTDILSFDITKINSIDFILKFGAATKDTTTTLAFGIASARNDAIDSITNHASLRIVNTSTTLGLVAETDDGTTDTDDVATAALVTANFRKFKIDFRKGLADVRFFVNGQPVAEGTTFDMSAATGGVQPYVQLQKTSDSNTDGIFIRRILVEGMEIATV